MQIQTIAAFSPRFVRINAGNRLSSRRASRTDFEDLPDESEEGKELAKQFYNQVKKREADARLQQTQMRPDDEESYEVKKTKKFTGRAGEIDSSGKPSAGLFAGANGSVYAFPVEGQPRPGARNNRPSYSSSESLSPRERMMRDEINFVRVASSEGTIIVQGILVLLLLGFTLYIGSTGGITDGSDRFGAMEGMVNEFNGLGESIDFSAIVNDDASSAITADAVKEGSVWL